MIEEKNEKDLTRDPELVEDEKDDLGDDEHWVLPPYDGKPFELSDDFWYDSSLEEDDEDGS